MIFLGFMDLDEFAADVVGTAYCAVIAEMPDLAPDQHGTCNVYATCQAFDPHRPGILRYWRLPLGVVNVMGRDAIDPGQNSRMIDLQDAAETFLREYLTDRGIPCIRAMAAMPTGMQFLDADKTGIDFDPTTHRFSIKRHNKP